MPKMTKTKEEEKEFVVIYKSVEHFEVLGYVNAPSMEKAIKKAQTDLLPEAKFYQVPDAEISEISKASDIVFKLS